MLIWIWSDRSNVFHAARAAADTTYCNKPCRGRVRSDKPTKPWYVCWSCYKALPAAMIAELWPGLPVGNISAK